MRLVALAGGVGGAKLIDGLAAHLSPEELTIIVNTGDDFNHLGLRICPDLDTICYTLGGIANKDTGWGRRDESWRALEIVSELGGPDWFRLGDRDIGTHLERTRRLTLGDSLSNITSDFCKYWGIRFTVLPVTDDDVPTWVYTEIGEIPFQEYFVYHRCVPRVTGFRFENAESAHPAPGVLESLQEADMVIICPSNPWVSIDPILAIPGVRQYVDPLPVVAVSPIIGGKAVKGPAAKMYTELGIEPSSLSVYNHYGNLLDGFVLDDIDIDQVEHIQTQGIKTLVTNTLMKTPDDRRRLAKEVLDFCVNLIN